MRKRRTAGLTSTVALLPARDPRPTAVGLLVVVFSLSLFVSSTAAGEDCSVLLAASIRSLKTTLLL